MSLTTFRKTGVPVPTPVWFAEVGDRLVVMTQRDSGKVKRIRHTTRITVAPCDQRGEILGETQTARARIMEPSEFASADRALNQKYGLMKRMFDLMGRFRAGSDGRIFLEITPEA